MKKYENIPLASEILKELNTEKNFWKISAICLLIAEVITLYLR